MTSIVALVPARGGSKGIPRKNVRLLHGRPLIHWVIEAALHSRVSRVIVSTEDDEIASIAREGGAEVPFVRPQSLATDEASTVDVALHAVDTLGLHASVLLLLQPTSPLTTSVHIDNMLAFKEVEQAESVVSVCRSPFAPELMYRREVDCRLSPLLAGVTASRRQEYPPVFVLNGAMFASDTAYLLSHRTFVGSETKGYEMPVEDSVDIDDETDWIHAETSLSERLRT